jgi:CelD/BcsL family acetyltransferase involved in cellulose biosynthesis
MVTMRVKGATIDAVALAARSAEWDGLAVAARRPYAAPGWALAWWEHMRPDGAELRAVAVEDGDELIGVAPFYARGGEYALVGCDYASNVEPLAAPGRERPVAAALAEALADATPRLRGLRMPQQGGEPDWPRLIGEAWPGRAPWSDETGIEACPRVDVAGTTYEDWLKSRSRNFRQTIRRRLRQLEEDGGRLRLATAATLERDVAELLRLHRERLSGRGGTLLDDPRIGDALVAAGSGAIASGRFRLLTVELGEHAIGAQLFLVAGDQVSYWNGGFDEAYGKYSPSMLGLADALELACELGGCLDLGAGAQDYKRRFTDEQLTLTSHLMIPRGPGYARTRMRAGVRSGAVAARRRLQRA